MAGVLGLVGGAGQLPGLIAREARAAGWRVVVFALADPGPLVPVADRVVPCRLGDVDTLLGILGEEGIRHVALGGRVWKDGLFQGDLALDETAQRLLSRSRDLSDETLLRTAQQVLESLGIELLDPRQFLGGWLAPAGPLAGPPLPAAARPDVARGLAVARELAGRGVGQTVVIRSGSVAAVEAMEGTDAAIRRGLELAGPGAVVVKAPGAGHDYRFDVPTVGRDTLAACAEGRAAVLAVEAGGVLLVDREAIGELAGRAGISVVGVPEPGAAS